MKTLKYILSAVLLIAIVWSCTKEEFGNTNFVSTAVAPTNVTALYNITQDNTGLVTITPNSEGAVTYEIYYGDSTPSPVKLDQGKSISHIYGEGNYTVKIVAIGVTGLKTEVTQDLVVSFKQPENLVVTITNDLAVSKKVNVTASADFATVFDVYFGETLNETPVTANIGGTASFIYQNTGIYTIRVVARGAAIVTTEYTVDFEVTAILQPLSSAPTPINRQATDVISIYSAAYSNVAGINYNPDWGQSGQGSSYAEFNLNGDTMLQYINLSYQGIDFGANIDASSMEFLHIDVWTADVTAIDIFPISASTGEQAIQKQLVADGWNSFDIPLSYFTNLGLSMADIFQFKFVGTPWAGGTVFIDNLYFYKSPSVTSSVLDGTWKIASEAGALKVGPTYGDGSWWSSSLADVTTRACFFDDTYVFNADGSFNNVLGADTWLEAWQGTADACGTPVAPYDGLAAATYLYDAVAGTVTVNGTGAYLGIPKANNTGELPNVAVPTSITYDIVLSNNNNTMDLVIEAGSGVFWSFKLIRQGNSGGGGNTGVYDLTLPIDFESTGFGANWVWNVFENSTNPALEFVANPSASGINLSSTVAKITALQAGQPWVGTETAHGEMGINWDLSTSNSIIKIMVYKTVISDVGIKLVNPAGGAQVEIKVANTKINQWEELTFDFSARIGNGLDGSTNIDQIVVFPDFDLAGRTQDNVVYFDNITFQ